MNDQFIIVLITTPDRQTGEKMARQLLEQKLAACVNIFSPVTSLFRWQGKIETEQEALLLVKTRAELFASRLVPTVRSLHPYDEPEIIALPILSGSQSYLDWIEAETTE